MRERESAFERKGRKQREAVSCESMEKSKMGNKEEEQRREMQVWYSANEQSSEFLANSILSITKLFLQPENQRLNKVSDSSYYILYKATVPSVMVECGFMSNVEENNKLKDDSYQKQLAYTITMGINTYMNNE